MIVVRDAAAMAGIDDPLVQQRYAEISAVGDVHLVIAQVGDTVEELERECGPILTNIVDGSRYGDADFTPCFEALEEHARCYEMVFIASDDGGLAMYIQKNVIGIPPELLADFCLDGGVHCSPRCTMCNGTSFR